MTSAIAIERICMEFGTPGQGLKALDDVSLDIHANEFFTLLGPSGCGKTTLLRLIAGFEQPSSGSIRLYGEHMEGLPPFRRPVNTVFQSYALFPHMSVADNIGFGLEMQGRPRSEIDATVSRMLDLVKLPEVGKRRADQLSGGQQQRIALARALASRPKVLLLDESLSALDLKLRKEMQIELKRLQHETGITFIFVTHDQEEALSMSDRIAVMSKGKVLQVGTPSDIYEAPLNRAVADFIGETNFLEGQADADGVRLADGQRLAATTPGSGAVTLAIRPERTELAADGQLEGVLENIVYVGTDTVYHLNVAGQPGFRVRQQNRDGARCPHSPGGEGAGADSRRRHPGARRMSTAGRPTAQQSAERRQLRRRLLLSSPAMLMLVLFLVIPLGIMFAVSIQQSGDYGGVKWGQHSLEAYLNFLWERDLDDSLVFNADYLGIFQRSFWLSLLTTLGCLALGFPTALYLALQPERRRNLLLFLVTVPFWTNLLVRVYAWILLLRNGGLVDAGLQGIGLTDTGLGLLYTDNAVIIGLLYTYLPFMVLPIYSSLEKMDWRLVEAAFDLGANRWKALRRVIVPLAMPGIVAGCILVFIPALGSYIIPELLGGGKALMIGNLIQLQFGTAHNWPFGAALSFALLAFVLLAMLIYNLRFRANAGGGQP
ncbi:ole(C)_1_L06249 [Pseudomonas aeruginosa]|nr:Vitamin B12 import ATP-binding protein BtuD [Pseudomonas aeruginosa]VCX90332.1 ole(C)_1_L06249 [Pseudomonas aeruginosa]VDK90381.1 ole(C)_1_L06249 [Pseudomonas aeruginosa]